MAVVTYSGVAYPASPGESVLETLLRNGVPISNSCRAGACQACLLRASGGTLSGQSQQGLKETLTQQGYFLSCVCRPEADLTIEPAGGLDIPAAIDSLERLTPTVLRARLRTTKSFAYRPGQFITLRRADGLARSYSLASLPEEETLELHIRRAPQGRMSGWLFDHAKEGEPVTLRGPAGDCFYSPGRPEQPLLLVGTGTGLAPLAGICKDAIRHGHTGTIHIFHGALNIGGLYLQDELGSLVRSHPNVTYSTAVREGGQPIDKAITSKHPKLHGWRGFVCGDATIVRLLKKTLFIAGMASRDIFSDSFIESVI